MVLGHGYLSQPAEVNALAERLQRAGMVVYIPRLAGHGTSPDDLANKDWEDWYAAYMRGVVALRQCCDHVVAAGFSTAGLLAMIAAADGPDVIDGLIAINPPLQLQDKRVRWAPLVDVCNRTLDWLGLGPMWYDVANSTEQPLLNYERNPIHGVAQLHALSAAVWEHAPRIACPMALIQGHRDPVVRSGGADLLQDIMDESITDRLTLLSNQHRVLEDPWLDDITAVCLRLCQRTQHHEPVSLAC